MSVYVDDMKAKYGCMTMCHMVADTEEELHEMADKIGVARTWYQEGHYDLCLSKRAIAVRLGAKEITWMQLGRMTVKRRREKALAEALAKGETERAAKIQSMMDRAASLYD